MARGRLALTALVLGAGCGGEFVDSGTGGAPIIDGDLVEQGWPAVGALVTWLPDRDPSGSFCSASLIAPRWVLTAGHCLEGTQNRVPGSVSPDEANYVHFFMGARADRPNEGRLVRASRLFIHENYDSPGGDRPYDIALVELAEPVTDVDPIPIHRAKLEGQEGSPLFYVGFGQSNIDGGGSGRKRSATLALNTVLDVVYVTRQEGGGVCFGDSGGPGMLDVDGTWEIIGVNSTVFGGDPPCGEYSTQIRVDAYQTWIDAIMGQGGSCQDDLSLCACPEACNVNGVCESAECGRETCADILTCLRFCSTQICSLSCFLGATPAANYMYEAYAICITERCPSQTSACVEAECRWELTGCREGLDAVTGDATCADTFRCREACVPEDQACLDACEFGATLDDHGRLEGVDQCVSARCEGLLDEERDACAAERCRNSLLVCLPDERCALAGGGCGATEACTPEPWVATYCRPSMGFELGAPCDPLLPGVCADGAHCVDDGAGSRCREACVVGSDCTETNAPCQPFAQDRLPYSVGVCSLDCPDADADGACDAVDCAPFDGAIHPGAAEVCDPYGIDENCDGIRNEGCNPCADPANAAACEPMYVELPPLAADGGCGCFAVGGARPSLGWLVLPLFFWLAARRRGCALAAGVACFVGCAGEDPGALDAGRILVDGGAIDAGFLPAPDAAVGPDPGIFEIQQGLVATGALVTVEAIVVSPESGEGFYVSDGTERAYSGIWVQVNLPLAEAPRVRMGDLVQVTGEVAEHAFETEADPPPTGTTATRTEIVVSGEAGLAVVGQVAEMPGAVPLSMVELQLPEVAELYEGVVVQLGEAEVSDRLLDEGELEVNDLMRVDDLFVTFDVTWVEEGSRFSILQGPLHFEAGVYKIAPRDQSDLLPAPVDVGECMPVAGYSFCLNRRNWFSARRDCGRQGGRLVILETLEENTLTSSLAVGFTNRSFWVGASDLITEGQWLWTDGSTLAYDPWHAGEPNDAGGREDCAHHNWRNRQWNDAGCGRRDPFFCEFRPGMEPVCEGDADCAQGEGRCVNGSCRPPLPE